MLQDFRDQQRKRHKRFGWIPGAEIHHPTPFLRYYQDIASIFMIIHRNPQTKVKHSCGTLQEIATCRQKKNWQRALVLLEDAGAARASAENFLDHWRPCQGECFDMFCSDECGKDSIQDGAPGRWLSGFKKVQGGYWRIAIYKHTIAKGYDLAKLYINL